MVDASVMLGDIQPAQVWSWLEQVSDPEIPVISVVDLGIVRDVALTESGGGTDCTVTITPTYSGCPAMLVIAEAITRALQSHGVRHVRLATQLSPAWTTDWMSAIGKEKLRAYGIAPPTQKVIDISGISRRGRVVATVPCPLCGSTNTRVTSEFGSTACKALYRCADCLEPFDYFKCH
ncbi:MAG: phenylacetate-CoA oxygenase [Herminiimonas sp.]|nr:phenylacetate-CoA oxygenase [Herminiimonas sp.]